MEVNEITEFKVLSDGWTSAPEGVMLRGGRWSCNIRCYATAFLLRRAGGGYILVDTGYSSRILHLQSMWHKLYRLITPVHITDSAGICGQLKRLGVSMADIEHVVLTHLHPDHIGGLRDFPNAKIHLHSDAIAFLRASKGFIHNIVFDELLPFDFWGRVSSMQPDVFGDGSLRAVALPGHAVGQVGILFKCGATQVFLAADSCWLSRSYRTNIPPNNITGIIHNIPAYNKSLLIVHEMSKQDPNLVVLPSHCPETANLICRH